MSALRVPQAFRVGVMMRAHYSLAHELREIARLVRRIPPADRQNPERVYIAKDEAAARLEALARKMEAAT